MICVNGGTFPKKKKISTKKDAVRRKSAYAAHRAVAIGASMTRTPWFYGGETNFALSRGMRGKREERWGEQKRQQGG
jgi:hypothetical protein